MEYTIQSGDSLYQLSIKFGIPLAELMAANPQLQNPDLIYSGQIITIPQGTIPKSRDKYRLPEPYPKIRVVGKNPFYAQILLEDYAGKVSETTYCDTQQQPWTPLYVEYFDFDPCA